MNVSIITPTHRPEFLARACASFLTNKSKIEWIVVENNGAVVRHSGLHHTPHIIVAPNSASNIGALKSIACAASTGDIIIELDHDDELLPCAVDEIVEVLAGKDNAFFYSDTIEKHPDGRDVLYSSDFGWDHGTFFGSKYNKTFPVTARSLCEIFYAPNHVRAWTRKAYELSGGHDVNLSVCDDQDLMQKMYLAGTEFIYGGKPMYVQYMHGGNAQKERNALIQKTQAELRNKRSVSLALEWAKRNDLFSLDLGGAHGCPDGFRAVDRLLDDKTSGFKIDIEKDLLSDFPDNSVGVIRAHDFLEHIKIGRTVPLMNDIHRVLAPGGWLISKTPSTDGRGAFQDPTHVSFWNQNSFWYYTREEQAKYVPDITARFEAVRLDTSFPSEYHKVNNISYVTAWLCALKGQRHPHSKYTP